MQPPGERGTSISGNLKNQRGKQFNNGIHVLVRVTVEYHILHGLKLTLIDIDTSFTLGELEKQKKETPAAPAEGMPDFIRMEGEMHRHEE